MATGTSLINFLEGANPVMDVPGVLSLKILHHSIAV